MTSAGLRNLERVSEECCESNISGLAKCPRISSDVKGKGYEHEWGALNLCWLAVQTYLGVIVVLQGADEVVGDQRRLEAWVIHHGKMSTTKATAS